MFGKKRRYHMSREAEDINVIPVMNLFMVLIPFLLLGAAFYQIGVIPTSTATHDPTASDVPETPTTVAASLVINPDSLSVTFASTSLTEEELQAIAGSFPNVDGDFDLKGLQRHLRMIKERYPESTTMTILPHDSLDYQSLVRVLDTAREYPVDPDSLDTKYNELFPVTVFSKLITASSSEDGGEQTE